jgi:Fur family ferric uptake transcriptional regulator
VVAVSLLIANSDDHLSAEEIYNHTKELHSEIGLATVYRNLELLEKLGIVHRFDYGDGQSRYELRLGSEHEHYHHHLICKQCGFIGEFHSDLLEEIEQRIAQESGFQVTDHCLRFFGICAECQKKAKEKETQEKPNT